MKNEIKDFYFEEITLKNVEEEFRIPSFHKSLSIPNGDLYLCGGTYMEKKVKNKYIMKYSFEEEKMLFLEKMNIGRSSHSMVFLNDFIYVIGGFDENN